MKIKPSAPGIGAAICLAAFLVIAIFAKQIYEHIPNSEDEAAYLFQAELFAQNRLTAPTPQNKDAFWSPFVVDYQGRRFGKYPPGWPLLLSVGVRLGLPWLINAALALLTLALLVRLGACFYGSNMGLWAAALALAAPGFLFLSGSLLSHPASLFWVTLALLLLCRLINAAPPTPPDQGRFFETRPQKIDSQTGFGEKPTPKSPVYALMAGAALGAAFITRPFAALGVGLAIGVFLLVMIIRNECRGTILVWFIGGGLPVAALLPLYWEVVSGDPTFNPYVLVWPYDRIGFGPEIGPYGYTLHNAIFINMRLKLTALAGGLFGWPGWSNLFFLPLPFLAKQANRWDWLLLGTLGGLIFVHLFYWAFGGVDGGFPRYYYDALPALLLLTVRGIRLSFIYLTQVATQRSEVQLFPSKSQGNIKSDHFRATKFVHNLKVELLSRPSVQGSNLSYLVSRRLFFCILPYILLALVLGLIAYSLIWRLPPLLIAQKYKYGITKKPLQVVAQADLQAPALVIVKNVEGWNDFVAPFAANSPTLDSPVVYAIDWGPRLTRQVQAQFKERTCWLLDGDTLSRCPPENQK